jgi:hypothetical protein
VGEFCALERAASPPLAGPERAKIAKKTQKAKNSPPGNPLFEFVCEFYKKRQKTLKKGPPQTPKPE